jgi:cell division protein FtsI/penicillin-binding protein 2
MAMALEERLVNPSTTYQDFGYIQRWDRTIWNWDRTANGATNMTKLLVKSANAGAVWLVDKIGADRFYRYARDFGFGRRTNVDMSGEVAGEVRQPGNPNWSPFDLMTHSFGQALTSTPLQLATAVCAVANGGVMMQPQIVREIRSAQGIRVFRPVAARRVMSPETAATLSDMLVDVVTEGASKAIVDGYRTAGKSGTTQITVNGAYSDDQTIASFVQYPRNKPPFLVYARVDQPKDVQWGGQVAGPVAKEITAQLLAHYRIPPDSLRRDV